MSVCDDDSIVKDGEKKKQGQKVGSNLNLRRTTRNNRANALNDNASISRTETSTMIENLVYEASQDI